MGPAQINRGSGGAERVGRRLRMKGGAEGRGLEVGAGVGGAPGGEWGPTSCDR